MRDLVSIMTTVWTPQTLIVATIAGFTLGAVVLAYLTDLPAYASDATPIEVAVGVAVSAIIAGAVFYAGQIIVDSQEDLAVRLVSRFGVWVFYSVAMAGGTAVGLAVRRHARHRRLRALALEEVDDETLPPRVPRV